MYFLKANAANIGGSRSAKPKFIVIHYTANNGDTARGNCNYFKNNAVKASAHYFVDEKEVCQSVPEDIIAYHCGGKTYIHKSCRNSNSLGIEMCSRKSAAGLYYFKDQTIKNAAKLTADLMKKYNIPLANVIRHYDVTGKNCPAPFVENNMAWVHFKELICTYFESEEDKEMKYYEKISEIPAGEMRNTIQMMIDKGAIKGSGTGLHLSEDIVRFVVFLNRMGIFNK